MDNPPDATPDPTFGPTHPSSVPVLLFGMAGVFAIPPLVFFIVGLTEGMGAATFGALVEQYSIARQNLFMVSLPGLFPLALLGLAVYLGGRFRGWTGLRSLAVGGTVAILAVQTWVNVEFWPTYLPARTYPGFPHGLEFVIGPIFFAPLAMLVGMVLAAVLTGRRPIS